MIRSVTDAIAKNADAPVGEFVTIEGERYYAIHDVDRMAPFFMSIVSDSDHWLFVSSAGGLSAGRVSPQSALFPYIPVDRIHEAAPHTGSKTLLRVYVDGGMQLWEPFGELHQSRHCVSRHLYKNVLGNKLRFEEVNHSLDLTFRYTWTMSDRYGFVRQAELLNMSDAELRIDVLDGLQNLLPPARRSASRPTPATSSMRTAGQNSTRPRASRSTPCMPASRIARNRRSR